MTTTSEIYQCTLGCQKQQEQSRELLAKHNRMCASAIDMTSTDITSHYCVSSINNTILHNCEKGCVNGFLGHNKSLSVQNCLPECINQAETECEQPCSISGLATSMPTCDFECENIKKFNDDLSSACLEVCTDMFGYLWFSNKTAGEVHHVEEKQP